MGFHRQSAAMFQTQAGKNIVLPRWAVALLQVGGTSNFGEYQVARVINFGEVFDLEEGSSLAQRANLRFGTHVVKCRSSVVAR